MHTPGKFSCIDMFAGRARISKAFAEIGHNVCTFDISRDDADDPCIYKTMCILGLTSCLWVSLLWICLRPLDIQGHLGASGILSPFAGGAPARDNWIGGHGNSVFHLDHHKSILAQKPSLNKHVDVAQT